MTAIPETVRAAVVRVCRDAFWYKGDARAVFLTAGVPPALWDRYDNPDTSKPKIARLVLGELQQMGSKGEPVQRKIVEELCRMDRPLPDAVDQQKGKQALADLKRAATAEQILVDPEKAAADQRRARDAQRLAAVQQRQARLGDLRARFFRLLRQQPGTQADRQSRGYELEQLLVELFQVYEIDYRKPYRIPSQQLDGAFNFRGFTYIVEAKWQQSQPTFGDLAEFKTKVDGKLDSTRGLFIAMAGFDDEIVSRLQQVAAASRHNLILADDRDLIEVFEGRIKLPDALLAKINAAEQEGRYWYPLGR